MDRSCAFIIAQLDGFLIDITSTADKQNWNAFQAVDLHGREVMRTIRIIAGSVATLAALAFGFQASAQDK